MHSAKQSSSVCLAITRLRAGVVGCCWIAGLALACQALIWALAVFTELRFEGSAAENAVAEEAQLVVHAEPTVQMNNRLIPADAGKVEAQRAKPSAEADGARKLSSIDTLMSGAADTVGTLGRLAVLILLPIMALGVLLGASASVPGVEKTVSAFMWTLLVAVLILPLGGAFQLPWEGGALGSYGQMMTAVDQMEGRSAPVTAEGAAQAAQPSSLVFYGRFLLLPATCIVGLAMVGLRFCTGVEAAVLQRESMKLDPALEREAANIKPSSLHSGGRSASILSRTVTSSPSASPSSGSGSSYSPPSEEPAHRRTAPAVASTIEEPAEESAPRRLI